MQLVARAIVIKDSAGDLLIHGIFYISTVGSMVVEMRRTLLEATNYVLAELDNLGIHVDPSTRFGRMSELFKKQPFVSKDNPDYSIAREASRDIQIMAFGFDHLIKVIPEDVLKQKAKLIVKDSVLPENDKEESLGRNTQAELYIAAICQAAGLAPAFEEPDIVMTLNKTQYGLAIKRIKNIRQFGNRFRSAVNQIRRWIIPGYVVIDWTIADNPSNKNESTVYEKEWVDKKRAEAKKYVNSNYNRFKKWQNGTDVRGLLFVNSNIIEQTGCSLVGFHFFVNMAFYGVNEYGIKIGANQRRKKEAALFWKKFEKGIPYSQGII